MRIDYKQSFSMFSNSCVDSVYRKTNSKLYELTTERILKRCGLLSLIPDPSKRISVWTQPEPVMRSIHKDVFDDFKALLSGLSPEAAQRLKDYKSGVQCTLHPQKVFELFRQRRPEGWDDVCNSLFLSLE